MTIDRNSPDYLAGRADAENERGSEAEKSNSKRLDLDALKKLSPDEVNARWAEVQAVLEGRS